MIEAASVTLRQARVLEVLATAGAPVSGDALAARLGVRAGSLSMTLRSLQRRGLIVAAARERARPGRLGAARPVVSRATSAPACGLWSCGSVGGVGVGVFCLRLGVRSAASSIAGEGSKGST